jgi:hypothetical protein
VGCAFAAASGGECGPSALAGAVTSFAGPFLAHKGFYFSIAANATIGGVASVAGGGKFENGAITGAFGYIFNAGLHPGPALVGTDAHQVLLNYLQSGPDGAQWTGNVGLGGLFGGGRPDLLYSLSDGVNYGGWEIKPLGQDAAAAAQLQGYIDAAGSRVSAGDNALIFRGAPTLMLDSNWFWGRTTYTYYSGANGVVTYSVNNTNVFQQVFQAFAKRPAGGASPLPVPVPIPVP